MLTLEESLFTAWCLIGIAYNCIMMVYAHTERPKFTWRLWLYVLLVTFPHLAIVLYALIHLQLD